MRYIITGYGKFGRIAAERLSASFPDKGIIVIEPRADQIDQAPSSNLTMVKGDAVSYLTESGHVHSDDMVIPMVPFHLNASYLMAKHPDSDQIPFPEQLSTLVPNPYGMDESNLCCSRADFLCPDDCPEGETCTVTGELREEPLYGMLGRLEVTGFEVLVQRSYQVLPGVGGYPFGDLLELEKRPVSGKYIVATACKCHGVITALIFP
ncbi:NAD-binding protein [Thermodesulfobacteriota bacterium]